jgi:RND family efflux transporter MFP subunit
MQSLNPLLLAAMAVLCGCQGQSAKSSADAPPAKVSHIANEEQLNTIVLSESASKRLGIEIAKTERKKVARTRIYGGEVMTPPGASILVSAPVAGTLDAPAGHAVPGIGTAVKRREQVFRLVPLMGSERSVLSPAERIRFAEARNTIATARIDAEAQMQQAQVQLDAAHIALERAERLLKDQAGTARAVDEAQAQETIARKGLDAAKARKDLVDKIDIEDDPTKLQPLEIEAPREGIVRSMQAAAGEVVAAGAPLFEIMDPDPVWIKVTVYVGELTDLDVNKPITVRSPIDVSKPLSARPVQAPPTATPLASSVDMYYELANPDGALRPGQRVDASVALNEPQSALVVPWSAVMHDIQGGAWVYQRTAPLTFVRRRVQVRYVLDNQAVLADGLQNGVEVVTAGAMELFGTEFGFAK